MRTKRHIQNAKIDGPENDADIVQTSYRQRVQSRSLQSKGGR